MIQRLLSPLSLCLVIILIALLSPHAASGQDLSRYRGLSPAELLERSQTTPSTSEKAAVRNLLATKHKNTPEGHAGDAWIAGYLGDGERKLALYEKCLAKYADMPLCLYNVHFILEPDDAARRLEHLLATAPSFNEHNGLRSLFLLHVQKRKDRAAAEALLKAWEPKLKGSYVIPFIRGLDAQFERKDHAAAEKHYAEAVARKPPHFEPYRRLGHLRLHQLTDARTPTRERLNQLAPVFEYIEQTSADRSLDSWRRAQYVAEAWAWVGDQLVDVFKDYRTSFDAYVKAFETYPTGEAAEKAAEMARRFSRETRLSFLETANTKLPGHPLILTLLGETHRHDVKRAERYLKEAIDAAHTPRGAVEPALMYGREILESQKLEFDGAASFYRERLALKTEQNEFLTALYENRRRAGDFEGAADALRELHAYWEVHGDPSPTWFADRHRELERFMAAEEERERFYRENPFLRRWNASFGDSVRIQVNFASGSSAVARKDHRALTRVAKALSEPGADKYIFEIEGHTDAVGSAAGNRALSLARARAIVRHLHTAHEIPLERMKPTGQGEDVPVASNATPKGRAANRRVEIVPLGNVEAPSVSATSALATDRHLAVSPNGRLIATGFYPMQLWDAQRGVRLRDLGRGTSPTFSPDGRYVAAPSGFTEAGGYKSVVLYIYDTKTGLLHDQLPVRAPRVTAVSWAPDGDRLVYGTSTGWLAIYDLEKKKRVAGWFVPSENQTRVLHWTRDGEAIITGQATERTLRVWDAKTRRQVDELTGVNWPHAINSTTDGRYLTVVDNTRTLTVWDTTDGNKRRQMRIASISSAIVAHPENPWILVNDFGGGDHHKGLLIDIEAMKVLAEHDSGDRMIQYGFSTDGSRVYAPEKESIAILDAATLKPTDELEGTASLARSMASDLKNHYVLTTDSQGVHVWDVTSGRKVHLWRGDVTRLIEVEGEPSRFLAVATDEASKQSEVLLLDTDSFSRRSVLTVPYDVRWLTSGAGVFALVGTAFTGPNRGATEASVEVYELASGERRHRATAPMVTERLRFGSVSHSAVNGFDLDLDRGQFVLATEWVDGFGRPTTTPDHAILYSLTGEKIRTFSYRYDVHGVQFVDGDVGLRVAEGTKVYARDSGDFKETLPTRFGEHPVEARGLDGDFVWSGSAVRYTPSGGKERLRFVPGDGLEGVEIFPDKNLFVWLRRDNTLTFFDLTTFEPQLTLVSKRDNQWIAWAPSGEFVASLSGADKVFWSLGDLMLPFDALAKKFEKPDVVERRLSAIFDGRTSKAAEGPELQSDLFVLPYELSVISDTAATTNDETFTLRVRVTRARDDLPAPELLFTLQGQDLEGARGFERRPLEHKKVDDATDEYARTFPLRQGLNVIQVSLLYKDARLLTQTALVTRGSAGGATSANRASGGELYFLGLGVSKYQNDEFDLSFPHKDATALAKALEGQEGQLYRKVHTRLLLDEQVTAKNVKVAMHEFLRQASSVDSVVIFVAGHGVQDTDQTLYFMTHDADLRKPYTGMDMVQFHQFLKKRPPNQKAIFWMDICHAGAYDADVARRGRVTAEEAIRQLADGTGLVVLASSTGRESSLESKKFGGGHGAFSAALLEALAGQADKDAGNSDGMLTVVELMSFVSRRVPQMTGNRQHPTTPHIDRLRDFPFALMSGR